MPRFLKFAIFSAAAIMACLPTSARAAELLVFERAGCVWCERWKSEVGTIYHKTAEGKTAPLRFVHLDRMRPAEPALKTPVIYTPTFVFVENGREVGRIIGYINDGMFWGQLGQILAQKPRVAPTPVATPAVLTPLAASQPYMTSPTVPAI